MTEAGIVSTLKRLSCLVMEVLVVGGRASATFISSNTGRSPGRHSGSGGVGGGGPGS